MAQFKQVVEAVLGEELNPEGCAALLLNRGIHAMMEDIIGTLDPAILQDFVQQLGTRYPAEVYASVAENLARGASEVQKQRLRRRIGFHPRSPGEED